MVRKQIEVEIDTKSNIAWKLSALVANSGTALGQAVVSLPIDLAKWITKSTFSGIAKLWSAVGITVWNIWKTLSFPFNSQIEPTKIWKNYWELSTYKPMSYMKEFAEETAKNRLWILAIAQNKNPSSRLKYTLWVENKKEDINLMENFESVVDQKDDESIVLW